MDIISDFEFPDGEKLFKNTLPRAKNIAKLKSKAKKAVGGKAKSAANVDVTDVDAIRAPALAEKKVSPFSKLAVLKNSAASMKQKK